MTFSLSLTLALLLGLTFTSTLLFRLPPPALLDLALALPFGLHGCSRRKPCTPRRSCPTT
jgi:hypothetical protein